METMFDIAIVGAGPAGCSAALSLRESGCSVALFERKSFPRVKICGDGLCDRSINTLRDINPRYVDEFFSTYNPESIQHTDLIYKNRRYGIDFKNFGYTCKRENFDNFLFSLVQRDCRNVTIFQNTEIQNVDNRNDEIVLFSGETMFRARIVIVCNGALSRISRILTGEHIEKSKLGVAVRAYYNGVKNLQSDTIELYYKKEFFPGYLWVFPLADGSANVGFGWQVEQDSDAEKNVRSVFEEWLSTDKELSERFRDAERLTPIQGGLVPYCSESYECCGDNFFICGDAANLIDPISGGGIGNAMLSGRFAALQAVQCLQKNDCSKQMTEKYVENLQKRIKKEMHIRHLLQKQFMKHRWLLDVLAFFSRRTAILRRIKAWYLD